MQATAIPAAVAAPVAPELIAVPEPPAAAAGEMTVGLAPRPASSSPHTPVASSPKLPPLVTVTPTADDPPATLGSRNPDALTTLVEPSVKLHRVTALPGVDPAYVGFDIVMGPDETAASASRTMLLPAATGLVKDPDQLPPSWVMICAWTT